MEKLWHDVRQALRGWRRRPAMVAVVVATLALGIGANAAIFAVVDAVLLRPLPYDDPDRLAVLWAELPAQGRSFASLSGPELLDLEERARSFAHVGGVWALPGLLRVGGRSAGPDVAEEVEVGWITPGFLEALGVAPQLGRFPTLEEHLLEETGVIVLSHELWQHRYAGDPEILGKVVDFDDVRWTVIGVMPRGFEMLFPRDHGVPEELVAWLPWGANYRETSRKFRVFTPVARLADGVSPEAAAGELASIASDVRREHADYAQSGFELRLERLHSGVVAEVEPILLVVFGMVALVLLVACANVGTLLLLRASEAERELAVRAAIGAGPGRLVRQMLTESLLLALLGGGAALLVAEWSVRLLQAFEPGRLPRLAAVTLDGRVLVYIVAASVLSGLAFGLVSALQALRGAKASTLHEGRTTSAGARTNALRRVLVTAELALAAVLLCGAGLLVRTFVSMSATELGFEPKGVATMRLSLPDVHYRYQDQGDKIAGFYVDLTERVAALPGVDAVGATTNPPLSGFPSRPRAYAYDGPEGVVAWESVAAEYRTVTPGWFEAAGVRLVSGRFLDVRDDLAHPTAVVVDVALAAKAWPGRDAVGQRIQVEVFRDGRFGPTWGEVVGVVETVSLNGIGPQGREQVYIAHAQSPQRTMNLAVRTRREPAEIANAVQAEAERLEAGLPVFDVRPATSYVSRAMAGTRFALLSLLAFAGIAVVLATAGVYAATAYTVAQRRHEIGIRLALGATPARIVWQVLGQGLQLAVVGAGLGLAGALAVSDVLSSLLFGVTARDPATYTAAALLVGTVVALACALPARRAAAVDPAAALKAE